MHNDFTLFNRTYPNGSKVVFYYAYDKNDKRLGPWSTKCRCMTAARLFCNRLLKADALIPQRERPLTFGQFAAGFWEAGSDYLTNQMSRGDITPAYIANCKKMTANQIVPFFGEWPLEKITYRDINKWLLGFAQREGKAYKNTYANTVFGTLNVMLAFATEQELLKANPCARVKRLKNDRKKIEIITVEVYQRPYNEQQPVVCLDETNRQFIGETKTPLSTQPGQTAVYDYEYIHNGIADLFMLFEPLAGGREVEVSESCTKKDFARCLREPAETHYPDAKKIGGQ